MPCPGGKRSARETTNANPSTAASPLLTLSHSLVQFLSLLQLQGYVSHLVHECDIHHMNDLSARVTCEEDVEKILGPQASLQHRQELWRGLCKWKQTARKRAREVHVPNKVTACVADIPRVAHEEICEKITITSTSLRYAPSKNVTPSQFMRGFAFQGYEERMSTARGDERPPEERQEKSAERHSVSRDAAKAAAEKENEAEGESAVAGAVQLSAVSSNGSSLWSTSGCGFSQTIVGSDTKCDRLPLAALAVGTGRVDAEENAFAEEWGFNTDSDGKDSLDEERDEVREESDPAEDVLKDSDSLYEERDEVREESKPAEDVLKERDSLDEERDEVREESDPAEDVLKEKDSLDEERDEVREESNPAEDVLKEKDSLDEECDEVREENNPAEDVLKDNDVLRGDDGIEQCRAEYRQLQESLRGTLESVVAVYNDGLQALQRKIRASLNSTPSSVRPSVLEVTQKPTLRISLHPALSELNGVTSSARVFLETHNNVGATSGRQSDTLRLSIVDPTVVSPPSDPSFVESADALPSLSSKTTHADGSGCPLVGSKHTRDSTATSRGVVQAVTDPPLTISLSLMSGEDAARKSGPVAGNYDSGVMAFPSCENLQNVGDGDLTLLDTYSGATEDHPSRVSRASLGSLCLEEFGLQALTQIPPKQCRENASSGACLSRTVTPQMTGLVESEVIDVDALSLTPNEETQNAFSFDDAVHTTEVEHNEIELHCAARPRGRSSPIVSAASLSPNVPRRQPAVPRDLSVSPPPLAPCARDAELFRPRTLDESFVCAMALDWTATSSAAAEAHALPPGRPPLPTKRQTNESQTIANAHANAESDAMESLTAEFVNTLEYAALRDWCERFGLCAAAENGGAAENRRARDETFRSAGENSVLPDETSTGWWAGAPRAESSTANESGEEELFSDSDAEEMRAAEAEEMRAALRALVTRRDFMRTVVPFFLHRLPRFSGDGEKAPERPRAAKVQTARTQAELDERRRVARAEEANEMACCVITSLVGNAVERIEQFAARQSVSEGLTVYEKLLLMEPTDLQEAAEIVRADFPFITRHRIETMLEESGIPIDTTRRVYQQPNSQVTNESDMSRNATQRTMSSCSPPPTPLRQSQLSAKGGAQEAKRQFFAQRGWIRRARRQ